MSDAWWRFDWAPTAGEWQALWGLLAVIATVLLLLIAWRQLTGLSESNRVLAESNDLLAASNKALNRPALAVELHLQTTPSRNYESSGADGTVFVRVRNVGPSVARDINLTVTPPFQVADTKIHAHAREFLRNRFSGESPIRMLTPGQELKYVLDGASAALDDETLPVEYEVIAEYTDISGTDRIRESFVLSMAAWALSIAEDDPMARLSKDIQFVSQKLAAINKTLSGR